MWHAWERNVYRVLMGKPEGKRPLGKPRCRWEDGIIMDLREIGSLHPSAFMACREIALAFLYISLYCVMLS
jgi:hypothetical protein